ncbi:hypothetical protein PtA15_17A361 [Puccinia triticina]|uniref:Uncharacterized protein n=1 Tax=Puccinia triticina TaxID=208348 RepID=A0ABY7D5G0_9BASI|nr:uncharacterized protein PtA15_17A361 [Puccinia triticina]WAQ92879.1 hypothetical protein PtA15_17A361 [Puccinia triticina]
MFIKGFSLPPPAGTGTANFTALAPAFGPGPGGEKPIMSITGTLAQGKAKKVADHLHLSSNKARRTQLREMARLVEPSSLPNPSSNLWTPTKSLCANQQAPQPHAPLRRPSGELGGWENMQTPAGAVEKPLVSSGLGKSRTPSGCSPLD